MFQGLKLTPFSAVPHSTAGVNLADSVVETALKDAGEVGYAASRVNVGV